VSGVEWEAMVGLKPATYGLQIQRLQCTDVRQRSETSAQVGVDVGVTYELPSL
jgi:hypothetical protein